MENKNTVCLDLSYYHELKKHEEENLKPKQHSVLIEPGYFYSLRLETDDEVFKALGEKLQNAIKKQKELNCEVTSLKNRLEAIENFSLWDFFRFKKYKRKSKGN